MAKFDPVKLKECVKPYGIDPNSVEFTASQPGKGGTFLGFAPWDSQRIMGLAVVNDLSYNSVQIGRMRGRTPDVGVTINGNGYRPDGKPGLEEYSPYRNYTSSNLTNPIVIIAVQIHELGHSLTMITDVRPETEPYSPLFGRVDSGTYLETVLSQR